MGRSLSVIIVPTKYYTTPTQAFRDYNFSVVIWANHLFRGAVAAMKKIANQIIKDENLLNVEDEVSSVAEVFRLQRADELLEAEKRYLPTTDQQVRGIVLAASRGIQLGELTEQKPSR